MKRLFALIFMFAAFSCIFAHGFETDIGKQVFKTETTLKATTSGLELSTATMNAAEVPNVTTLNWQLLYKPDVPMNLEYLYTAKKQADIILSSKIKLNCRCSC